MENSRYLIFTSAGRSFSLPFEDIKIIIAAQTPTPVPDFPDYVPGTVVNEGEVVPVIDQIGRASCRERVEISVVAGALKKTNVTVYNAASANTA